MDLPFGVPLVPIPNSNSDYAVSASPWEAISKRLACRPNPVGAIDLVSGERAICHGVDQLPLDVSVFSTARSKTLACSTSGIAPRIWQSRISRRRSSGVGKG
jgi:hypothetical protein